MCLCLHQSKEYYVLFLSKQQLLHVTEAISNRLYNLQLLRSLLPMYVIFSVNRP